MKFAILTSLPSAAIQLVYFSQTMGLKFSDVIIVGEDSSSHDLFREYSQINGFGLHFVKDPNGEDTVRLLRSLKIDVLQVITGHIIRKQILEVPSVGVVNSHAAWLPDFRGNDTPWWAVLEGGKLGMCIHFVAEGVDTGDIIYREELPLKKGDTSSTVLTRNHYELKWQSTTKALLMIRDNRVQRIPQKKEEGRQYFCMHPRFVGLVDAILAKRS